MEPNWGDPERAQPREDFSRTEAVTGLLWLCLGAAVSCVLEVLYLGATITVGGHEYRFPLSIAVAALFNYALVQTAALWSPRRMLIPLGAWIIVFLLMAGWQSLPGTRGTVWVMGDVWTAVFMVVGVAGGMVGYFRQMMRG